MDNFRKISGIYRIITLNEYGGISAQIHTLKNVCSRAWGIEGGEEITIMMSWDLVVQYMGQTVSL